MHSLFPQCIVRIKYALHVCSWIAIEITTNNYIHSVSRVSDCANKVVSFLDNGFSSTNFQLSSWGELLSFGRIRWHSLLTRWHSRGFLPTVRGRTNKNILLNLKFLSGFFCFSTHGSFLLLAPSVKRCKIFSCTVYKIGFSLDAETQSFRSFRWSNYINLNLHCSFPFSAVPEFT